MKGMVTRDLSMECPQCGVAQDISQSGHWPRHGRIAKLPSGPAVLRRCPQSGAVVPSAALVAALEGLAAENQQVIDAHESRRTALREALAASDALADAYRVTTERIARRLDAARQGTP